jgi:hypothetical protein
VVFTRFRTCPDALTDPSARYAAALVAIFD